MKNLTINLVNDRSLKRLLLAFSVSFLGMGFLFEQVNLMINTSISLPQRYFIYFPHLTAQKGDITLYRTPGNDRLIKKIIGHEGDVITYDDKGDLWVNDFKVGLPQRTNSKGQDLQRIEAGTIPKDFVFLYATHPLSLDSRYKKVGLVHKNQLGGKAFGLF